MKTLKITLLLLVLLLIAACAPTIIEDGDAFPTAPIVTLAVTAVGPTSTLTDSVTPAVEVTTVPTNIVMPTNTPIPTNTVVPQPTPQPTPIVAGPTHVQAVMALTDLNIRQGPGTGYDVVAWLADGQAAAVSGISSDGGWWQLICPSSTFATSCWVTAASIYTLPLNGVPTRIQFEPGTTSKTLISSLPVGTQAWYLAAATAGQKMRVEISSANDVANFSLVGVTDGQPYKRLENEDRFWEGILPSSQDYRIRVSTLVDTEFTLTLTIETLPDDVLMPVWPFVHASTGWLLGGSHNGQWLTNFETMPSLLDAERPYELYDIGGRIGSVTGSIPSVPHGACNQPTLVLSPLDSMGQIAIVARWDAAPRLPELIVPDTAVYQEAVAALLQEQGITEPDVQITAIARIDLEEDGIDEVLITASRMLVGPSLPAAEAGDYSLVALRKVINDQAVMIPLALNFSVDANDLAYLYQFFPPMLLDLNGDGRLEIIIDGFRYEGRFVTIFEANQSGVQRILQIGCTQ